MTSVSIRIDASRFQRVLSAVGGPGERMLLAKAERVAALARAYSSGNGTISEGIIVVPVDGKTAKVVSTNPHTLFVNNGTRPHIIWPRRAGGRLRFVVGGRVVFARVVNHPGFKGTRFMERALRAGR